MAAEDEERIQSEACQIAFRGFSQTHRWPRQADSQGYPLLISSLHQKRVSSQQWLFATSSVS